MNEITDEPVAPATVATPAADDVVRRKRSSLRSAIEWVAIILKDDPERARMTTARLEAELGLMREKPMRG